MNKRELLQLAGATVGTAIVAPSAIAEAGDNDDSAPYSDLTGDVEPISLEERLARVAKAQRLMEKNDIDAIVLEPGSAMVYFSGVRWWRSERLTSVVVPREGEIGIVTPYFEEPSIRESMTFGEDVRTWHEDENPFERLAGLLKDRGIAAGRIGFEDSVRFFVLEGLKSVAAEHAIVSALPVTLGCRMYKSAPEIALMKKANEVTLAAYRYVYENLEAGMVPADVSSMMQAAQTGFGGVGIWNIALFGRASAYPHGTNQPQRIQEGQIVLMDCGCSVHDYQSDISRTFVFGEPNRTQRKVWDTVRKGQEIAFEAAKIGRPAGEVDDAVRAYYESLGYGPGYATPGLSHRTGHGIGMDGHESVNFVHGEKTPLAPGMCFSNEPGLYDFNSFGVRLEDCLYMTDDGPEWFTVPPDSLDDPVGRMG